MNSPSPQFTRHTGFECGYHHQLFSVVHYKKPSRPRNAWIPTSFLNLQVQAFWRVFNMDKSTSPSSLKKILPFVLHIRPQHHILAAVWQMSKNVCGVNMSDICPPVLTCSIPKKSDTKMNILLNGSTVLGRGSHELPMISKEDWRTETGTEWKRRASGLEKHLILSKT